MAKYIRCSTCGKRIDFGQNVCETEREIFCDPYCFTDFYGEYAELSERDTALHFKEIFDDEQEKRRLEQDIRRLQRELLLKQLELGIFTNPLT